MENFTVVYVVLGIAAQRRYITTVCAVSLSHQIGHVTGCMRAICACQHLILLFGRACHAGQITDLTW